MTNRYVAWVPVEQDTVKLLDDAKRRLKLASRAEALRALLEVYRGAPKVEGPEHCGDRYMACTSGSGCLCSCGDCVAALQTG